MTTDGRTMQTRADKIALKMDTDFNVPADGCSSSEMVNYMIIN
jgi:hypothetical protein